jgi:hypothetical protein
MKTWDNFVVPTVSLTLVVTGGAMAIQQLTHIDVIQVVEGLEKSVLSNLGNENPSLDPSLELDSMNNGTQILVDGQSNDHREGGNRIPIFHIEIYSIGSQDEHF